MKRVAFIALVVALLAFATLILIGNLYLSPYIPQPDGIVCRAGQCE